VYNYLGRLEGQVKIGSGLLDIGGGKLGLGYLWLYSRGEM